MARIHIKTGILFVRKTINILYILRIMIIEQKYFPVGAPHKESEFAQTHDGPQAERTPHV